MAPNCPKSGSKNATSRYHVHGSAGRLSCLEDEKVGGGEGSRTPVRDAFSDGIYMFSRRSGVSERLGPLAALPFLETCWISTQARCPGFLSSLLSFAIPPRRRRGSDVAIN